MFVNLIRSCRYERVNKYVKETRFSRRVGRAQWKQNEINQSLFELIFVISPTNIISFTLNRFLLHDAISNLFVDELQMFRFHNIAPLIHVDCLYILSRERVESMFLPCGWTIVFHTRYWCELLFGILLKMKNRRFRLFSIRWMIVLGAFFFMSWYRFGLLSISMFLILKHFSMIFHYFGDDDKRFDRSVRFGSKVDHVLYYQDTFFFMDHDG